MANTAWVLIFMGFKLMWVHRFLVSMKIHSALIFGSFTYFQQFTHALVMTCTSSTESFLCSVKRSTYALTLQILSPVINTMYKL